MKKFLSAMLCAAAVLIAGCAAERLPAEDLEVPEVCYNEILILRNPDIPPNSKAKYDAIKAMMKKVDFTFVREGKTLNELLYHGDAFVDHPGEHERTVTFYYQHEKHYVRLVFYFYDNFILRVDVEEK